MISSVSPTTATPVAPVKAGGVGQVASPKAVASIATDAAPVASPAATMAKAGPPVDAAKVARIRAGIADGSYRADPQAIAQAMVQQDLGDAA